MLKARNVMPRLFSEALLRWPATLLLIAPLLLPATACTTQTPGNAQPKSQPSGAEERKPQPDAATELFTDESSILAVTREDQTRDLEIQRLRKEVTLTAAIKVLTTYRVVTRDQYFIYTHQSGAYGSVTSKGRGTCLWEIELDYAAVVTLPNGGRIYLLDPGLKVPAAPTK